MPDHERVGHPDQIDVASAIDGNAQTLVVRLAADVAGKDDDRRVNRQRHSRVVGAEKEADGVLAKLGIVVEGERGWHLGALSIDVLIGVGGALDEAVVASLDLDVASFGQAGSRGTAIGDGDAGRIGAGWTVRSYSRCPSRWPYAASMPGQTLAYPTPL